jgi:hypothetical protein
MKQSFKNPCRQGIYFIIVEALHNLGENEWHFFKDFKEETKRLMSLRRVKVTGVRCKKIEFTAWEKFSLRPSRSKLTGKDVNGRLIQNVKILQRLQGSHCYGKQLRDAFMCIDIGFDSYGIETFRLRTGFKRVIDVLPIYGEKVG